MSQPRSHHTTPIFRCGDFMCSHSIFLISISLCLVVAGSHAVGMQASNDYKRTILGLCFILLQLLSLVMHHNLSSGSNSSVYKLMSKTDHSLHGCNTNANAILLLHNNI